MIQKKTFFFTLSIILCLSICALAQKAAQGETAAAEKEYKQLIEKIKRGDLSIDFVRLRRVYGEWLNSSDKTDAPGRDKMVAAYDKKDYAKFVELAEPVFDYEYPNLGLHLTAEKAYRELGNTEKADFHKKIADKLKDALLRSGDGKSAKTAYFVLSIREEYQIMQQLGFTVSSQALAMVDNKSFDVLSGKDSKTGQSVDIWFELNSL